MTEKRGFILLCAGRGERLRPLTENRPKCMLPLAGKVSLEWTLDAIRRLDKGEPAELVVVTGNERGQVEAFLDRRGENFIRRVHNERYAEDTNIISATLGIEALRHPERGYVIVETDLVVGRAGWEAIFAAAYSPNSFWVTRDKYGKALTGGAVQGDAKGNVTDVIYAIDYNPAYEGYGKMVGILGVGPNEVEADRAYRAKTMKNGFKQYYFQSWIDYHEHMPARVVDIDLACTYNTVDDYHEADRALRARMSEL